MKHSAQISIILILLAFGVLSSDRIRADDDSSEATTRAEPTPPLTLQERLLGNLREYLGQRVLADPLKWPGKSAADQETSSDRKVSATTSPALGHPAVASASGGGTDSGVGAGAGARAGSGGEMNVAGNGAPINKDGKGGPSRRPGRQVNNPYYMPVCVFVADNVADAKANAAIKGMVDRANQCHVTLDVEVRTAKNVPTGDVDDPATMAGEASFINAAQVKGCNAQALGVPRAASTTITNLTYIAAGMCKSKKPPDPDGKQRLSASTAGCAQLGKNSGISDKDLATANQNDADQNSSGEELVKSSGGVAPSIEANSGQDGKTMEHEVGGHNIMGQPNGHCLGIGIGLTKKQEQDRNNCPGVDDSNKWTEEACGMMRAATFLNNKNIMYEPDRKFYYSKSDPMRAWDMKNPTPLFGDMGPPKNGPAPTMQATNGRAISAPGDTFSYDNSPRQNAAQNAPPPDTTAVTPGAGHKKQPGGGSPSGQIATASQSSAGAPVPVISLRNNPSSGAKGQGPGAGAGEGFAYDSSINGGAGTATGTKNASGESATATASSSAGNADGLASDAGSADGLASGASGGGPESPDGTGSTRSGGAKGDRSPASGGNFDDKVFTAVGKGDRDPGPAPRGSALRTPTGNVNPNIY